MAYDYAYQMVKKTLFIYISAYPNKVIMIANSNYEEFNHVSILQPYI